MNLIFDTQKWCGIDASEQPKSKTELWRLLFPTVRGNRDPRFADFPKGMGKHRVRHSTITRECVLIQLQQLVASGYFGHQIKTDGVSVCFQFYIPPEAELASQKPICQHAPNMDAATNVAVGLDPGHVSIAFVAKKKAGNIRHSTCEPNHEQESYTRYQQGQKCSRQRRQKSQKQRESIRRKQQRRWQQPDWKAQHWKLRPQRRKRRRRRQQ